MSKQSRNALWQIVEKILRIILSLALTALVARTLGPTEFGSLAASLVFVWIASVPAGLGLDGIIIREGTGRAYQDEGILAAAVLIRLSAATILVTLGLLIGFLLDGRTSVQTSVFAIVILSLLLHPAELSDAVAIAKRESGALLLMRLPAFVLSAALKGWLIFIKAPLIYFALSFLAEALMVCIANSAFLRRHIKLQPASFRHQASALLAEGAPIWVAALGVALYTRLDQLVVSTQLGQYNMGIYAAIIAFSSGLAFIPFALASNFIPGLQAAYSQSRAAFESRLIRLMRILLLLGCGFFLLFLALADHLILFFLGEAYSSYSWILKIAGVANILSFFGAAQSPWAIVERQNKVALKKMFFAVPVAITVTLIASWLAGLKGVVWALVFSQFFSVVVLNIFICRPLASLQLRAIWPRGTR